MNITHVVVVSCAPEAVIVTKTVAVARSVEKTGEATTNVCGEMVGAPTTLG